MAGSVPDITERKDMEGVQRQTEMMLRTQALVLDSLANVMQGDREQCLVAGKDDYVAKPIKPAAVRVALERWLSTHTPQAAQNRPWLVGACWSRTHPNLFVLLCEVMRHRRGDAMSTTHSTGEQEKLASSILGRVVELPVDATHLLFGMFGVQTRQSDMNGAFIDTLRTHFRRSYGPLSVEGVQYIDPQGYNCDLLLAY